MTAMWVTLMYFAAFTFGALVGYALARMEHEHADELRTYEEPPSHVFLMADKDTPYDWQRDGI